MSKATRKPLIAANWKMFKTPDEAVAFVRAFIPLVATYSHAEIVLSASPTLLPSVVAAVKATAAHGTAPVHVAAQDMHWLEKGAYTGETSPVQLLALGVTHVLIGHSERRQYFNETDETVNNKLKSALAHGLVPIVCVGELLSEREAGQTAAVLQRQVAGALAGVDPAIAGPLVIAYEPVWAIGTGKTATPEIADEAHKIVRAQIAKSLSPAIAASTRILYGGSVKPASTAALLALEDIDGALVGGASLEPDSFSQIVANSAV
jgi:triosephosphate isomerase